MYILNSLYHALTYLKSYNKYYEDVSNENGLSSEDIFRFFDIVEVQGQSQCVTEKSASEGKEEKI